MSGHTHIHTYIHTHRTTTVTLAAHACRGLIMALCTPEVSSTLKKTDDDVRRLDNSLKLVLF